MYTDFFTVNGIPQNLITSITVLFFLLIVAPIFSGLRVFGIDFPSLTKLGRSVSPVVGATGLFLIVLGFQPRWLDVNEHSERVPYCRVVGEFSDNDRYSVDWFTDSKYQSWTRITVGDELISDLSSGYEVIDWVNGDDSVEIRVSSGNRYGNCLESVNLWDPNVDYSVPIECSLDIDKASAGVGESYVLSWKVTGPEKIHVFINGAAVELDGQKTFTFSAQNYSRFHLVANSGGNTCDAEARIIAE